MAMAFHEAVAMLSKNVELSLVCLVVVNEVLRTEKTRT